jgi:hypothetical protein
MGYTMEYGGNFERQYLQILLHNLVEKVLFSGKILSFHISSKRTKYVFKKKNQILSSTEQSA